MFGTAALLAVLATAGFAMLRPQMLSSKVLIYVPTAASIDTQALIASSDAVLIPASRSDPALSFEQLANQVRAVPVSPTALTITVKASTAATAESAANAVAHSYVKLVWSLPRSPQARLRALIVGPATPATGVSQVAWVAATAGFGTLLGLVLGVIAAFTLIRPRRPDRLLS